MTTRPYWSGQIRLGLVFLPVQVFTAAIRTSQVPLHEYERKSGERIHHRNVNESGREVGRDDIVKGFELKKGEVVFLEQAEIDAVKLPSSDTLELVAFIDRDQLPVTHFERPYYVMPSNRQGEEVYGVLRDALEQTGKIGLGQVAMRGREELCAVLPHGRGLLFMTLRYENELRKESDFFDEVPKETPKKDYVALAKQLIKQDSGRLDLGRFHDRYHEALGELIKAKSEDRAPKYEKAPRAEKVVDLMEALRRSLKGGAPNAAKKKTAARRPASKNRAVGTPAHKAKIRKKGSV